MKTPYTLGIIGAAAAALLGLVLLGPGNAGAQSSAAPQPAVEAQAQPLTVNVNLSEFSVAPSVPTVPAGMAVHFVAKNVGGISHQLQIIVPNMPNVTGAVLAPGRATRWT